MNAVLTLSVFRQSFKLVAWWYLQLWENLCVLWGLRFWGIIWLHLAGLTPNNFMISNRVRTDEEGWTLKRGQIEIYCSVAPVTSLK